MIHDDICIGSDFPHGFFRVSPNGVAKPTQRRLLAADRLPASVGLGTARRAACCAWRDIANDAEAGVLRSRIGRIAVSVSAVRAVTAGRFQPPPRCTLRTHRKPDRLGLQSEIPGSRSDCARVLAPLPNVAVHIVQTGMIRLEAADRSGKRIAVVPRGCRRRRKLLSE